MTADQESDAAPAGRAIAELKLKMSRKEAQWLAQGFAARVSDLEVTDVRVLSSTVVYRRDGVPYHLVVHAGPFDNDDFQGFPPVEPQRHIGHFDGNGNLLRVESVQTDATKTLVAQLAAECLSSTPNEGHEVRAAEAVRYAEAILRRVGLLP